MKFSRLNFRYRALLVVAIGLLGYWVFDFARYKIMHAFPKGLRHFYINDPLPDCARWRDTMPETRDEDAFKLYNAARKLWGSKVEWQLTRAEAQRILDDVRTAAERGDWGARALLAHFYREGLGPLPENEVLLPDADKAVQITRMAVAAGQAWGFHDLGVAHEHGYGGAVYDREIAWAYYLRAAELGSPEAQMVLADAYSEVNRFGDEEEMLRCAFAQGHGPAAYRLGVRQEIHGNHRAAAEIFQQGVRFGDEMSAASLMMLFDDASWIDSREVQNWKAAGFEADAERARRYELIIGAVRINRDLRLPRLDDVLPLPPAPLPEWHGLEDAFEPESFGPPSY